MTELIKHQRKPLDIHQSQQVQVVMSGIVSAGAASRKMQEMDH